MHIYELSWNEKNRMEATSEQFEIERSNIPDVVLADSFIDAYNKLPKFDYFKVNGIKPLIKYVRILN